MNKALQVVENYILYILVFLFPILVLSLSPNPFVVPKLALLIYTLILLVVIKSVKTIIKGKLTFSGSKYDLGVIGLAVSYLASAYFRTPNKMEAIFLPGTATVIIAGALLYFVINQTSAEVKTTLKKVLLFSGVIFAVLTLLSFSGLFAKIPQLPAFFKARGFTPEGGFLPGTLFLTTLLPIGVGVLLSEKDNVKKALYGVSLGVIFFGLVISGYNLLPGMQFTPKFPSLNISWNIAVDTLKQSPLLGAGPGNYATAFNLFRPLSFNQTDLWGLKFSTANNFYMTMLTEVGLLGATFMALLLYTFARSTKKDFKEKKTVNWGFAGVVNAVSLLLLLVLFALFPATPLLVFAFFVLLALNAEVTATSFNLTAQSDVPRAQAREFASRFPALLVSLPVILLSAFVAYHGSRIVVAEYRFKKSLDALVRNDARETLEYLQRAIQLNPRVDRYHLTASRVYFALANSTAQKQNLTDQDRQNILNFIQGSIQEGKAAVSLNQLRAGNWETLGRTYQAIIPFAQGADSFATQALRQAVALDPMNPNLRIALGGVYYSRKDYDNAVRVFELAAVSKPDFPNAYFNLAYAYQEQGQIDKAVQAMGQVLSLVRSESQDFEVARKALEEMQAKQADVTKQATENLTPPSDDPEAVLDPKLELPEDANPPESPLTPTPTPAEDSIEEGTPSPTGSISPTVSPAISPSP